MVCNWSFLVSVGNSQDHQIKVGTNALAEAWGVNLLEYSCANEPHKVIASLPKEEGIVRCLGDAAKHQSYGGSWLEALGAWRLPTILIVVPSSSGELPGSACAYVALCESLSVPLVGIVQFGGDWNPVDRRLDGLPWCGWLPLDGQSHLMNTAPFSRNNNIIAEDIVFILQQRIVNLNL